MTTVYSPPLDAPADAPRSPSWGLGDALLGLGLFGVAAAAVVIGVSAVRGTTPDSFAGAPSGFALATVLLLNVLVFAGVPLISSRRKGTGNLALDFGLSFQLRDLPRGLAGGIVDLVYGAAAAALLLSWLSAEVAPGERLAGVESTGERLLLCLVIGILVPVAEELFFRGMVLRSLLRRNGPLLSAIASAALFALLHVVTAGELGAFQAAALTSSMVGGMVFAGLTISSGGRLGPAIVAHVLANQTALLVALS